MLWDLNEGKHLYSLEAGDTINALVFSPNRYWLCAATASCIKIFDLESKSVCFLPSSSTFSDSVMLRRSIVDELKPDFIDVGKKSNDPECTSLAWSADGQTLFAGYTEFVPSPSSFPVSLLTMLCDSATKFVSSPSLCKELSSIILQNKKTSNILSSLVALLSSLLSMYRSKRMDTEPLIH